MINERDNIKYYSPPPPFTYKNCETFKKIIYNLIPIPERVSGILIKDAIKNYGLGGHLRILFSRLT